MLDQLQVPLGPRRSIGDTYHYHVRSTLGSFGTQKIDRRYTPLPCQINFRFLWDPEDRQEIPIPCQINFRFLWDAEDRQEIHTIIMLDQLQSIWDRRSIGDTHHYHVRSTLVSFGTQKIDRRYIPLSCQINSRLLWDVEDRQEIHTIIMLDQLQVPLGRRRSIGDTHHYHVRSTLGSFGTQKIDRRYIPLPCQINFRFLWDPEDRQEIHTITMLDQLSRFLWDVEDRQEIHTIIMLDQRQVSLRRRRSMGDTHHYHVRSTLGSFGTQKINRRYIPLPCQINFRFLWDPKDRQEIHTITMLDQLQVPLGPNFRFLWDAEDRQEIHTIIMLDQLQVPLGPKRSIGDTYHYHVRSTLGSFGTQKINRRYTPLPCQINSRFLWDPEDRQEIHTITMLDQLQAPLGRKRSIGDTYHYHFRSTLGSFKTQKINRRYIPLPCQINFRFLWDPEDQQEIHTITMLDQLQVPLGPKRSIGDTYHYHVRSTLGSFKTQKINRRYIPLPCQINFRFL